MTKKITTISILIISMLLVSLFVVSSTYSVIINVIDKENGEEIIGKITIRDVLTDENGYYNETYYDVKRELGITPEESELLIDSIPLNMTLEKIIKDIVDYKLHHLNRMNNDTIYRIIIESINDDENINNDLKNKVTLKVGEHLNDIINYVYDFNILSVGELS